MQTSKALSIVLYILAVVLIITDIITLVQGGTLKWYSILATVGIIAVCIADIAGNKKAKK